MQIQYPKHGLRKRRALGQHFLKNEQIAVSIVEKFLDEIKVCPSQSILEIGPGRGALTDHLLNSKSKPPAIPLLLVEKDKALAEKWRSNERVTVLEGDFLQIPDSDLWLRPPMGVLSNLPYSSSTAILVRLASQRWMKVSVMVLMFQREVAQRILAEPGSRRVGSLSLLIQNDWDVTSFLQVAPHAFDPAPQVYSEVLVFRPRKVSRIDPDPTVVGQKCWDRLLRASFGHRRKMLRNTLPAQMGIKELPPIDTQKRPEALVWEEWKTLYEFYRKQ